MTKIMNLSNKASHLTWDTTWKSNNTIKHHTQESKEASLSQLATTRPQGTEDGITKTNMKHK